LSALNAIDGGSEMTLDSSLSTSFAATVDWLYAGLIRAAESDLSPGREQDRDRGLGGKLFYAGDLDGVGSALVVAATIAGAATLTASADVATQKQAIRDGVIDFLVTSLDEALRILKNELRKGETVAVCIAKPAEETENEMMERGVRPDLLPPGTLDAPKFESFLIEGAGQIEPVAAKQGETVMLWSVTGTQAHWLPKLDTLAGECLGCSQGGEEWSVRRWLRLAPRYLGRLAQGARLLRCQTCAAQCFVERVREQVASGEVAVPVEIRLSGQGDSKLHRFFPPQSQKAARHFSFADRR
jgi:urocanate hydratase